MLQYDMFGEIREPPEPVKETNRIKTMQKQFGTIKDHTCKECGHLLKFGYHNKTYYKCEMWKISHSTATDIKLKNTACGKWIPGKD